MEVALQPRDRPSWTEVAGILIACAAALALIVKLDATAAQRWAERARAAQPRTDWVGPRVAIAPPVGGAWSAGGSPPVAPAAGERPGAITGAQLRRIVGPSAAPAPPRRGRAAPTASDGTSTSALLALAACGIALVAAGIALLRRSAQPPPLGVTR